MAVISFGEQREWSSAGWVFETVLTKVLEKIPGHGSLSAGIERSLQGKLDYWDAGDLTSDELHLLEQTIDEVLEDATHEDSFNFTSDAFRDSFIRKTLELKEVVSRHSRFDA